jgi:hypothetical protein
VPSYEADALLTSTGGTARALEAALGLPKNFLDNNKIVRVDIPKPRDLNIRIPSGNEAGASELWLPGGRLPNGNVEAVIDANAISNTRYNVISLPVIHK